MFGEDLGAGIKITLQDDYSTTADNIRKSHESLADTVTKAGSKAFLFNQLREGLDSFAQGLDRALAPGYEFDAAMHDLSAISGVTGGALDLIGEKALELNAKFGGSASDKAESYKLLLSRIGPDIAAVPEALNSMGDSVTTLSKLMGGDAQGSAVALTTTMNIYASEMKNPIEQSREMIRQMNVMAAAAQVGSAEVPQIAETIKVAGLAAKNAGVNFEELNSMIQIMGKGAIYGSEAGTALRNTLAIMSRGEYMPKQAREGLIAAGVDIAKIGDASIPVKDRLVELSKIQGNAALIGEVFGMENQNAFRVLMQGLPIMDEYTAKMTGTNSAYDQAAIVMDSWKERASRVQAQIQNIGIQFFNATKSFMPFIQMGLQGVLAMASFAPAIASFSTALTGLKAAGMAAMVPFLPWIAVGAGLIALFIALREGINSFTNVMMDGTKKYETGFLGFLQKMGGIVMAVIQVFSSWNGKTWEMSEQMRDALDNMGILPFVLNLATWIVRMKEFASGMMAAFGEMWDLVTSALSAIWEAIGPVITKMGEWFGILGKNTGALNQWREAGKWVAIILGGLLLAAIVSVTFSLLSMAVAWVAATWPILAIIAVIGLVIYAIYHIGDAWDWVKEKAGMALDWVWQKVTGLFTMFVDLHVAFFNFGLSIVDGIKNGIIAAWDGLKSMLLTLIADLPFGNELMNFLGVDGTVTAAPAPAGGLSLADNSFGGGFQNIGTSVANTRGASMAPPPATVMSNNTNSLQSFTIINQMDGEEIGKKVIDQQAMKESRQ